MKFNQYIMENVLEAIIDYRGKTPRKSPSGITTLSAKSVKDGYIDYTNCYFISSEEYKRFMIRGFPNIGDVLLTTEAPLGNVARLDRSNRLIEIVAKDGANASTPIKPTIQDDATITEKCLAYIYVGAGVTSLSQANIEDTRANTNICGWVTGIIEQDR